MACPICDKNSDKSYRPFCSKRCADIDLGKWLTEGYSIPGAVTDDIDGAIEPKNQSDEKLH